MINSSLIESLEPLLLKALAPLEWFIRQHGLSKACLFMKTLISAHKCRCYVGNQVLLSSRLYFWQVIWKQPLWCNHCNCANLESMPWSISMERPIVWRVACIFLNIVAWIVEFVIRWVILIISMDILQSTLVFVIKLRAKIESCKGCNLPNYIWVHKICHYFNFVQFALLADLISELLLLQRYRFNCVDLVITSTSNLPNYAKCAPAK